MSILPIAAWLSPCNKKFLIAGPCSAETEDQVLATAKELNRLGSIDLFRAGIWKPRTRPGSFEGVGVKGLKWLKRVKESTGFKVTVEVAKPDHVEKCLEYGVDVLWIGARTTVNPFMVQEIADALRGTDIPVMVKNPVSPDLNLWIGAIERVYRAAIHKIIAIHRGFSIYKKTRYRNEPMWEIPIELRRILPQLPLVCDPSHICGNRAMIAQTAQKAIDLNFDGLMIETHIHPDEALSDSQQQLTPQSLKELLNNLIYRNPISHDILFNHTIEELREIIDSIDADLLNMLTERMKIVEKIGEYKRENNITILQPDRWNEIVSSRTAWAEKAGLSKDLILRIFQLIHQESIHKQMQVMNRHAMET